MLLSVSFDTTFSGAGSVSADTLSPQTPRPPFLWISSLSHEFPGVTRKRGKAFSFPGLIAVGPVPVGLWDDVASKAGCVCMGDGGRGGGRILALQYILCSPVPSHPNPVLFLALRAQLSPSLLPSNGTWGTFFTLSPGVGLSRALPSLMLSESHPSFCVSKNLLWSQDC